MESQTILISDADIGAADIELTRLVERLEVEGKRITEIEYPARYARTLGIAEHADEGRYRGHPATSRYGGGREIVIHYRALGV